MKTLVSILDFKTKNLDKWKNYQWQLQNRIKTLEELSQFVSLTEEEVLFFQFNQSKFPFAITPYYLSLIDVNNINCPIRNQVIPKVDELNFSEHETFDPLEEENNMPVFGLTHRYPDRVLWYLTHICPTYCRFCTRKRKVGDSLNTPEHSHWKNVLQYIQVNPQIKEVILSGGDPLSLSNSQLDNILFSLKSISHINQIRIHSRYVVTNPYRVQPSLIKILSKYFPIYLVTHFNHSLELTEESIYAIQQLICEGHCILLNQSVLLRGVNDNKESLMELNYKLVQIGIKPYYLHQCDEVNGISHFRVDLKTAQKLYKNIRGYQSGIAVPSCVIDLTGGGGKVPIPLDYLRSEEEDYYLFENFKGNLYKIKK